MMNGVDVPKAQQGQKVTLPVPGFNNGALIFLMTPLHGENLLGEKPRITVDMEINIQEGKIPLFELMVLGTLIKIPLKVPASKPEKHPFSWEQVDTELRKFESDIFTINKIVGTTDNSFIPKSEITNLRKQLDQQILDALVPITAEKQKVLPKLYSSYMAGEKKVHVQVYDLQGVQEALHAGADFIYYDVFASDLESAITIVKSAQNSGQSVQFYVHTPMVLVDEDIDKMIPIIQKIKPNGILANNVAILRLDLKLPIILGYQMNIFNDNQLQYYGHPAIASIELNAQELAAFKNKKDLIFYTHGQPVVMTFKEHIDANRLTDKEGYTFPLRVTKTGATEMLYSRHIGILQRTNEISHAGITQIFLDLEYDVGTLTTIYKKLLRGEHVNVSEFKVDATVGNLVKGVM